MKLRSRLDEHLVACGYFSNVSESQAWILCGRILVNGAVCTKAGTLIGADSLIKLRGTPPLYSSRGGLKLREGLRAFGVQVEDKVVLDAGAATGGFTDCLLQHGARHVYAVDVGFGQLKGKLAADPRVTNWERVNISDLTPKDFKMPLDLCTVDLSFLSLATALPILKKLFCKPYAFVCLVKPLFEGLSEQHRAEPGMIGPVLIRLFEKIQASGITIAAVTVSPILGSRGTVEFLMYCNEEAQFKMPTQLSQEAMSSMMAVSESNSWVQAD